MGGFSFSDFLTALGMAFVLEGLIFLAFPEPARRIMASVAASPLNQLRVSGIISAVIGLGLIWIIRG